MKQQYSWGLKKIKTLPYYKMKDFLKHSLERENLLLAYRSFIVMVRDYGYTEEIYKDDRNPNYEIITKLLSLKKPEIDLQSLINHY